MPEHLSRSVCRPRLAYETRYGFRFTDAVRAEFWWRVEHLGYYRGGDGGLFGAIQRWGYRNRKAAERRATHGR